MRAVWILLIGLLLPVAPAAVEAAPGGADVTPFELTGFSITEEVVVPGTPEIVYDHLTGDISGWWDHTMSGDPVSLVIEPRVGGRFLEVFDESGDAVEHGRVTFARRGRRLTFEGPLGFHGEAMSLVCNYRLSAAGEDSTRIALEVNGWGEKLDDDLGGMVGRVWHHFLVERFVPYVTEKVSAPDGK